MKMVNIKAKIIKNVIFFLSFIAINSRHISYEYENGRPVDIYEQDDEFVIDIMEFGEDFDYSVGFEDIYKEDEVKELTGIFDEIFKGSNTSSIHVKNSELTDEQNKIIIKILDAHYVIYQLRYEIINNVDNQNKTFKKKGYSYEYDNGHKFTIAMGERPSGGYSINIRKTKIKCCH